MHAAPRRAGHRGGRGAGGGLRDDRVGSSPAWPPGHVAADRCRRRAARRSAGREHAIPRGTERGGCSLAALFSVAPPTTSSHADRMTLIRSARPSAPCPREEPGEPGEYRGAEKQYGPVASRPGGKSTHNITPGCGRMRTDADGRGRMRTKERHCGRIRTRKAPTRVARAAGGAPSTPAALNPTRRATITPSTGV